MTMFCFEAPSQILPEDYLFKNSESKLIKVKDGIEIYLIHINENSHLNQANNFFPAAQSSVITEQIKNVNFNDHIFDSSTAKNTIKINSKEHFTNLKFSNFFSMVESDIFEKKLEKNIEYLNGSDKYGLTIIYKKMFLKPPVDILAPRNLTIFFIHGVGGNSLVWRHQLKYFAELNYEIIAIDLIGHGKSTKSKIISDYEFVEICSHIRAIFDKFARNYNMIIGHSYGSSFAVNLAQERRDLIQKVVLISGGMPYPLSKSIANFFYLLIIFCQIMSILF